MSKILLTVSLNKLQELSYHSYIRVDVPLIIMFLELYRRHNLGLNDVSFFVGDMTLDLTKTCLEMGLYEAEDSDDENDELGCENVKALLHRSSDSSAKGDSSYMEDESDSDNTNNNINASDGNVSEEY